MARSSRRGRRARRKGRWRRRLRTAILALVLLAVGLPPLILLALRFVPPPTTAFMLRYQLDGAQRSPLAAHWVDWERIAPDAALAVIAAEDQKFLDHPGFDFDALRDAVRTARRGGPLRGASTISQQVSKNLFLWPGRSFVRKALEAGITAELELLWSKRRILEVYLNVAGVRRGGIRGRRGQRAVLRQGAGPRSRRRRPRCSRRSCPTRPDCASTGRRPTCGGAKRGYAARWPRCARPAFCAGWRTGRREPPRRAVRALQESAPVLRRQTSCK